MNPIFYFLTLTAILAATVNAGGPVLDSKGHFVFSGSYYVIPRLFGAAGGGLNLVPRGDKQCPLYIGHDTSEVDMGIPVRFSNWVSRVGFVPESEDLNIMMDVKATTCSHSNYWWVTSSAKDSKTWFIMAGPEPKTKEDSSMTSFQIRKTGDALKGYKIMYCPKGKNCTNVGIMKDKSGVRRLVLSSKPFPVVFVKAT